jgi:hypothetical protein
MAQAAVALPTARPPGCPGNDVSSRLRREVRCCADKDHGLDPRSLHGGHVQPPPLMPMRLVVGMCMWSRREPACRQQRPCGGKASPTCPTKVGYNDLEPRAPLVYVGPPVFT